MKRKGLIFVAGFIIIIGAVVTLLSLRPSPQPRGHSAQYWLDQLADARGASKANRESFDALTEMGTNAIPTLIRAFADYDSKRAQLHRWVYASSPPFLRKRLPVPKYSERIAAAQSILLSADVNSFVDQLVSIYQNGSLSTRVQMGFLLSRKRTYVPPDCVPKLVACLADTKLAHDHTLGILARIGLPASNAAPAIVKCLVEPDDNVRANAAYALWKVSGRTNDTVPVLEQLLGNPPHQGRPAINSFVLTWLYEMNPDSPALVDFYRKRLHQLDRDSRITGCIGLKSMGAHARSALPDLWTLVNDSDPWIKRAALEAIALVEPKAQ